jgi:hypothetical protein
MRRWTRASSGTLSLAEQRLNGARLVLVARCVYRVTIRSEAWRENFCVARTSRLRR